MKIYSVSYCEGSGIHLYIGFAYINTCICVYTYRWMDGFAVKKLTHFQVQNTFNNLMCQEVYALWKRTER